MKEIGGMLGINESRVSQIHKTAIEEDGGGIAVGRNSLEFQFVILNNCKY